jgi:hypothetical protein
MPHRRSPYLSVPKACDLHCGLDRVGVVCLAAIALGNVERGIEAPPQPPSGQTDRNRAQLRVARSRRAPPSE